KTTLATNLAAIDTLQGVDAVLIDCDKQGSSSAWSAEREATDSPRVPVFQKFGGLPLTNSLKDLEKRFGRVYVDAGGYDSEELRAALLAAQRTYVPIRPSQLDVWTLGSIIEIIGKARLYNA